MSARRLIGWCCVLLGIVPALGFAMALVNLVVDTNPDTGRQTWALLCALYGIPAALLGGCAWGLLRRPGHPS